MISRMFGAPLGGTMRGGHHGFDCAALSLITPPNSGSGGGSCLPLIVVVAFGEPGTPADLLGHARHSGNGNSDHRHDTARFACMRFICSPDCFVYGSSRPVRSSAES